MECWTRRLLNTKKVFPRPLHNSQNFRDKILSKHHKSFIKGKFHFHLLNLWWDSYTMLGLKYILVRRIDSAWLSSCLSFLFNLDRKTLYNLFLLLQEQSISFGLNRLEENITHFIIWQAKPTSYLSWCHIILLFCGLIFHLNLIHQPLK